MAKAVCRFGIAGLVVSLLSGAALSASAQGMSMVKQSETSGSKFQFKDICIRSLFGINDEVLADTDRFPLNGGFSSIELGVRFGDFTNATVTISKDRDTGKPGLAGMRFYKEFGPETDDKELLREYERTVDLVSKLLGVKVECLGLVDPNANVTRRPGVMRLPYLTGGRRITSRTSLRLAKGQLVEIAATEASYVIRSGQPIQTASPIVSVWFCRIPFGTQRSEGDDAESVKELTLGLDYSELLSVKMRVEKEELKLQELKTQNQKKRIAAIEADEKATAENQAKRDADAALEKVRAEEEKAQREAEREQQRQHLLQIQEELKRAREARQAAEAAEAAMSGGSVAETNNTVKAEKASVAEKLETCDFLLNKDFKKNAKYYLCLFSASWCPPCRREMPRIAKTYAETLKDDPDIELIHFSRDQDDDKALAWAKEHDVKFPVVKPKGGNPLDLKTNGIPHLFILKADGTIVEHDHPMRIFNEEKFKALKGGVVAKTSENKTNNSIRTKGRIAKKYTNLLMSEVNGVKWLYVESGNGVNLVGADSSLPKDLVVPNAIDGKCVLTIEESAFEGCGEIVSLKTPSGAMSIGYRAFAGCPNLESVRILSGSVRWSVFRGCPKLKSVFVGGNVRSLEYGSLAACEKLESVVIEGGIVGLKIQDAFEGDVALKSLHLPARYDGTESWCHGAFGGCPNLTKLTISEGNRKCRAENGIVLSADGKTLLSVASGLSKIDIPHSVETIPYRAISGCSQIRELIIPDSVKVLDNQCICHCDALEHITIGSGIERICSPKVGSPTFYDCPSLTAIRFVGNAPAQVDDLIYQAVSPALITFVPKGSKGWNREGVDKLPTLWPVDGVNGRKIAYWGDESIKAFEPNGPYGIHMMAEPGCEDGADYVLGKLTTVYLPRAVRYYGDPFNGKKPSRIYPIRVRRSDKGIAYRPGVGEWSLSLAKDRDTYECSLDYLASSVLTVCEEPNWSSFVFYVNIFIEADAKGQDPVPQLKRDIEKGLSDDGGDGNGGYRAHAPLWAALEDLRAKHPTLILDYCKLKNKRFAEGKLPKKLSLDQMASLLSEVTGADASALFEKYGVKPK